MRTKPDTTNGTSPMQDERETELYTVELSEVIYGEAREDGQGWEYEVNELCSVQAEARNGQSALMSVRWDWPNATNYRVYDELGEFVMCGNSF